MSQTVVIDSQYRRDLAHRLVAAAPVGAVMTISPAKRSSDQNARFGDAVRVLDEARRAGIRQVGVETVAAATGK